MKKILVVTGTRAEYGLLYRSMKAIQMDPELELQLIVTGNHLSKEYGYTVDQIIKDGFSIDDQIDMIIDSQMKSGIAKSMGLEIIQMANSFERLKPDLLLILGDRYETFTAAICATMMNIPIAHMNGGESTEGALDEQIRHAITKMAHIHFPGAEYYKERIIKMGEEPWRVYNVGQAGVENIAKMPFMGKDELESDLGIQLNKKLCIVTYHPVTLSSGSIEEQMESLLSALQRFDMQIIFTYPNADFGSKIIIDKITQFASANKNANIFYSLGQKRYLSVLKYADVMVGNSSSGIIEAPILRLPVVNIGDRQKGRLRNKNIIDVGYSEEEIYEGIYKALYNEEFRENLNSLENVYGDGTTSQKVVDVLKSIQFNQKLLCKKLNFE